MKRTTVPWSRLWQIRRVLKRHALLELLSEVELPLPARAGLRLLIGKDQSNEDRGRRIRCALEELGPIFVKLGQALSTRPDLLPADIAEELTKLQDQVPPIEGDQAIKMIRNYYGENLDDIFASIDEQPMASASVAQVHAAVLKDGNAIKGKNGKTSNQVIVKVLRPGVHQQVKQDVALMYWLAARLEKYWSRGAQFKPLQIVKEYDGTIHGELDLRQEAGNCSQMAANFQDNDIIYVPAVYWDYTQREVMVMERIYGTSVRDMEQLKSLGYDLKQLASDGVETFFKQAFEDNFFHADMHPGNIFVSDQGKWIAIDFGIMGVLSDGDKRYLAEMLLGFFNRDYRAIAETNLRAEWIPAGTQVAEFESAIRMVCEPNFAKPISEISFGMVLIQLFQTIRRFDMPVQPQLVLLYKTLLNIEGLGRQLYPQLNLWDTAKPFLENWIKKQLGPEAIINNLKRDWPHWQSALAELPAHLERQMTQSKLLEQQQIAEPALLLQAKTKRLTSFHQILGFGTAVSATTIYILANNELIKTAWFTVLSPWIGVLGLGWAYWHSKK